MSYSGTLSGEYGSVACPFAIPDWARPKTNVASAMACQSDGAPGYLIVKDDGSCLAQAWGKASDRNRMGSVAWPVEP